MPNPTDTAPSVPGSEVTIETADGPMPAHVAAPAGTPKGAVLVVQEAFGLTDHIKDVAGRFAAAGWQAIAPALFHRQGSPVASYEDISSVMPMIQGLTAGGITTDLTATLDQLEAAGIPQNRIAVVGFCMGGSITFYAATLRPLGAAVSFYGGGVAEGRFGLPSLVDLAPTLATPWLGLYGDLDQGISIEHVEQLRAAAKQATVDTEVVRYPNAGHGFHCTDRSDFEPDSASDAWGRTLAWLDSHITG